MKVALLQILPGKTQEETNKIGLFACQEAKKHHADIALFPEMFSNGYHVTDDENQIKEEAISINSGYVQSFRSLARQLNMAIGITLLEQYEPLPRNSLVLFDRHGEQALIYSKVHTCDFDVEQHLTSGDDFYVCDLDINEGVIRVGAMICYDREFPESARILMLKGAEVILVPNACPMEINRLEQLRSRAFENMVAIATCNYPTPHPDCNGFSSIFDGIAWFSSESDVRDMCILKASTEAGLFYGDINISQLREYRKHEVFGNAYRHPSKYHKLMDEAINEPFVRSNRRK